MQFYEKPALQFLSVLFFAKVVQVTSKIWGPKLTGAFEILGLLFLLSVRGILKRIILMKTTQAYPNTSRDVHSEMSSGKTGISGFPFLRLIHEHDIELANQV